MWLVECSNWMDSLLNKTVQEKVLATVLSNNMGLGASLHQLLSHMPDPDSDTELDDCRLPKQEEQSIPGMLPVWKV